MPDKYKMTPTDRDLAIRTIIGEASDQGEDGQTAVGHVINNRLRSGRYGDSLSDVVLARHQFEPWATRPRELLSISPKSPEYQRVQALFDKVLRGDSQDPTNGATHFIDKNLARRTRPGGRLPDWASGAGQQIGDHTFYAPEGRVRALGYADPADEGGAPPQRAGTPAAAPGPRVAQASGITLDDMAETLRHMGMSRAGSAPRPAPPSDDLNETMRQAGVTMERAAQPVPKNPIIPEPEPGRLGPGLQAEAERTATDVLNPATAAVTETPLIGPAATGAASLLRARPGREPTVPGNTFEERAAASRSTLDEAQRLYRERNPWTTLGAGLLGSTALTAGAASTWPGRLALGMEGPSVASRITTGGVGSGALGAADSYLRGESPITGFELGAAGGVAGPLAGAGAESLLRRAGNAPPLAGPLAGVNAAGRNMLSGALEGETPASIQAGRDRMGPAGMAADVNTGMTDLAGGVADISGPGKQVVREAYRLRNAGQRGRIDQALTDAGMPHKNIEELKHLTVEERAKASDPLYQQWRTAEVHPTPELQALIPRLESAGAFKMAEELAGISGNKLNKAFFVAGPQKEFPTTETWDLVKRGLDRRIDQAYAGQDKTLGRELVKLKREMIDEIEKTDAGKIWKQARHEFSSRSNILDQIEAGKDTFLGGRSGTSVDELRDELHGLGTPEIRARLQGLRTAAEQVMGDTLKGDTTLRNKILAPNNQEKMRLLLGNQEADRLIQTMEREQFLRQQSDNVVGGSQTTPKAQRVNALLPPQTSRHFNLAEPASWIPRSMNPAEIPGQWRAQRAQTAVNQLAPILTTPEGPGLDRLLEAISREGRKRSRVENVASRAGNLLSGAIAGPGSAAARRFYQQ